MEDTMTRPGGFAAKLDNGAERAGKMLSAANKKRLDDAADHLQRAMERHKAMGDHLNSLTEQTDDLPDVPEDLWDEHEDAGDAHRALGRSLRAAHRCLRAVLDGAVPASGDSEQRIETSAGEGQQEGARSADHRRRELDLLALAPTT